MSKDLTKTKTGLRTLNYNRWESLERKKNTPDVVMRIYLYSGSWSNLMIEFPGRQREKGGL